MLSNTNLALGITTGMENPDRVSPLELLIQFDIGAQFETGKPSQALKFSFSLDWGEYFCCSSRASIRLLGCSRRMT